jgi:DNA-binding NarL/FixJ family response regulator
MAVEQSDDRRPAPGVPFGVVIVDDQRLVRDGIRLILEQGNDFRVVRECSDGDEVVSTLREIDADVVLMDMRMKRVGGAEAITRLRRLTDPPPVLVLTTYDDDETLAQALTSGAAGFVLKESPAEQLRAAVRAVAQGAAFFDPVVAPRVLDAYREARAPASDFDVASLGLSPRELEVLRLLAAGKTNPEIAETLYISRRTARAHVSNLLVKLRVNHRGEAAALAHTTGLI